MAVYLGPASHAATSPPPPPPQTIRVKSAAWDDNGVLIYTTLNHIKYCLPNGDNGIIRTLEVPVYITKVIGSMVYALDREGKNRQIQVRGWRAVCLLLRYAITHLHGSRHFCPQMDMGSLSQHT